MCVYIIYIYMCTYICTYVYIYIYHTIKPCQQFQQGTKKSKLRHGTKPIAPIEPYWLVGASIERFQQQLKSMGNQLVMGQTDRPTSRQFIASPMGFFIYVYVYVYIYIHIYIYTYIYIYTCFFDRKAIQPQKEWISHGGRTVRGSREKPVVLSGPIGAQRKRSRAQKETRMKVQICMLVTYIYIYTYIDIYIYIYIYIPM